MPKSWIKSAMLLGLIMLLFYWKILLTHQFSLLTDFEAVNQGYSWFQVSTNSIRQGICTLWDPYTWAGHSFAGEMQTAAFDPLHLLFAFLPLNRQGVISPKLYHEFFVLVHFLGACFMFALIRELRLSKFSAFIAAVCFSLGGFVSRMGWPHMLESAIWLPLIFLLLLRPLKA